MKIDEAEVAVLESSFFYGVFLNGYKINVVMY